MSRRPCLWVYKSILPAPVCVNVSYLKHVFGAAKVTRSMSCNGQYRKTVTMRLGLADTVSIGFIGTHFFLGRAYC